MEAVSSWFEDVHQFHTEFKGQNAIDWCANHTEVPVFAVSLYLALVFIVPELIRDWKPLQLRGLLKIWNLLLATYSIIGATFTVPILIHHLTHNGFKFTVCEDPENWYANGPEAVWVFLFIISKIPELIDTVFLVVQHKPVIFLHWYHHTTVLFYCWHAFVNRVAPGLWFAAMNYGVHSIMYSYYFLMGTGMRRHVKPIAPIITILQLSQMVIGAAVISSSAYWKAQGGLAECFIDPSNCNMGLAMYLSYFLLFALFFKDQYCGGSGRKAKGKNDTNGGSKKDS